MQLQETAVNLATAVLQYRSMADDHRGRALPPRDHPRENNNNNTRHYPPPPPPTDDEDRLRPSHHNPPPAMATAITLPSMQDYPQGPSRGHPAPLEPGSRTAYSVSPTEPSNYPPPSQYHLPPVHALDTRAHPPPQDPRQPMPYRPAPADARNGYYPGPPPPGHHQYPDPYGYYRPQPGMMGPYDYRNGPGGAQANAPRQRTSIACRYCRKRKIRCSGYQTTADGKCLNCKKTGNECVFQPVSSGSTAFVPVTAIPGGVAPGTQLFGAFGEPLRPRDQHQTPPQMPLPSPTGSSYYDDRSETGRRRPRGPDDEHHGPRLPPPHPHQQEDDPRRRSPASAQSNTPPTAYSAYPRTQTTPPPTAAYQQQYQSHPQHQQHAHQYPPHPYAQHVPYAPHPQHDRPLPPTAQPPHRESPVGAPPQHHQAPPPQQQQQAPKPQAPPAPTGSPTANGSGHSIMSLNALMDHRPAGAAPADSRDIDNSMLGRLNSRRP